jgi:hypothetical protein
MDDLDQAQLGIEMLTAISIRNIREKAKKSLIPSGYCYYCEEEIGSSMLFCSAECRDDYSKEQRIRSMQGH